MSAEAADRDSEMLRELAELGLAMARDLAARSAAAEDDAVANNLARSFERVSRSVRHCLALIVRLKDGERRRVVEAREQVAEARRAVVAQHRARVREAIERYADEDPEVGDSEVDYVLRRAGEWLERETERPAFLDLTPEQHIDRLRVALGRTGAADDEEAEADNEDGPGEGHSLDDLPWRHESSA